MTMSIYGCSVGGFRIHIDQARFPDFLSKFLTVFCTLNQTQISHDSYHVLRIEYWERTMSKSQFENLFDLFPHAGHDFEQRLIAIKRNFFHLFLHLGLSILNSSSFWPSSCRLVTTTEIIIRLRLGFLSRAPELYLMLKVLIHILRHRISWLIKFGENVSAVLIDFEELCASKYSVHLLTWSRIELKICHLVWSLVNRNCLSLVFLHVYN